MSGSSNGRGENDAALELTDPTPSIYDLFAEFNVKYFEGKLGAVTVEWSKRMTSCAGLCYYSGRHQGCRLKLSAPLLSLRPRKDLIETLLHEMIHAYFFMTQNSSTQVNRDGHGPDFVDMMNRINARAGTNITVYHSFYDELDHLRQHWWKCSGPCKDRRPYFGLVKRSMNRAPGPNDLWYDDHQRDCGGTFTKIKEPPKKKENPKKRKIPSSSTITSSILNNNITLDNWVKKAKFNDENEGNMPNMVYKHDDDVVIIDDDSDEELARAIALSLEEEYKPKKAVEPVPKSTPTFSIPKRKFPPPTSTITSAAAAAAAASSSTDAVSPIFTIPNLSSRDPAPLPNTGIFGTQGAKKKETSSDPRFPGAGYRLGG